MPKIRKMKITDEDGKKYEVEEEIVGDEVVEENPGEQVPEHKHVDEPAKLTDDEIKALKDLAACAPELMGLLKKQTNDEEVDPKKPANEEIHDPEEVEDEDEEKILAEEKQKIGDSLGKSVGSRVKPTKKVNDSADSLNAESIDAAWSKRYN